MTQPAAELLPLVYVELRELAAAQMRQERPGHTLNATALVHEAYLRLGGERRFESKRHFLAAATQAMRHILIDNARKKLAEKRDGGHRFELSESDRVEIHDPARLLALDEAIEKLAAEDAGAAEMARLRLYAGLSVEDAGEALGLPRASAYREWAYARAWLTAELSA
jgi:RNA polymerase sigma factor (TIGR02999 family)